MDRRESQTVICAGSSLFDEYQKRGRHEPEWVGLKMLAGGAAGLLVALGLCGIGAVVNGGDGGIGWVGFYLCLASGLVVVLAVPVLIVDVIVSKVRNGWERSRKDTDE